MSETNFKYANDNIKLLLKFKGWTQDMLSKKTGISQVTLRRRLSGTGGNWTMLEGSSIAKALGKTVTEVFFTRLVPNGNSESDNKSA